MMIVPQPAVTAFAFLIVSLVGCNAFAQPLRTFVSTAGIDNVNCSRTEPCRTFGAAISVVAADGEVVPLDSGGYLPFVVTKSVGVVVPIGIHAAVAPTTGTAISISAGVEGKVTLRGLYLNNQGTATRGIDFVGGAALHVERCEISGFPQGLEVTLAGNAVVVSVNDSTFQDGGNGLLLQGSFGGILDVSLDNCRLENNSSTGLYAQDRTNVTAHHVVAAGNFIGFYFNPTLAQVDGMLTRCVATGNTTSGVEMAVSATVHLAESVITDNETGVKIDPGGEGFSLGDNLIEGNDTNVGPGVLTILAGQ